MNIVLKTIFTINIYASVMILTILAVSFILKGKVHNKIICFLWLLVLARLVIPITLESPVHLDALLPQTQAVEKLAVIKANTSKPVSMDSTPITTIEDSEVSYTPPINPHIDALDNNNEPAPYVEPTPPSRFDQAQSAVKRIDIWTYALIVWAIGVVTLFARAMVAYLRFKRRVKLGRQIKDLIVTNIATECKAALSLDKKVNIITCPYVRTPVTFGFVHPIVLLPIGISHKLGEHKLRMVILHELCHIKRKDIFINYLWLVAKIISWFNPLIYIAYKQHLHAIEIACDEMVLKNIGQDDSFDYSESLLDVLRMARRQKTVPVALSFCRNTLTIRKRVENMIRPQRKLKSAGFISILLAVVMVVGCFTTACPPAKADSNYVMPIKNDSTCSTPSHINEVLSINNRPLRVTIDADVIAPNVSSLPIVPIEPTMITQKQVDNFLDTFYPNRKITDSFIPDSETDIRWDIKPPSKSDIQKEIDKREKWIASSNNSIPKGSNAKSTYAEKWQYQIDQFKEYQKDLPDDDFEVPEYDITKFSSIPLLCQYYNPSNFGALQRRKKEISSVKANDIKVISYEIDSNGIKYNVFAKQSKDPNKNYFHIFDNSDYNLFTRSGKTTRDNTSDIPELTTTYNEAKSIADKALQSFGIDYMGLYSATELIYQKTSDKKHYYRFVYSRKANSLFVTVFKNIPAERCEIFIDDSGIVCFNFTCFPTKISDTAPKNISLLPFENIIDMATVAFESKKNIFTDLYYDNDDTITINDGDIVIEKIVLGYILIKDDTYDKKHVLVPVWDFIGRTGYDVNVEYVNDGEDYNQRYTKQLSQHSDQQYCLTINAIDGSIIDRGNCIQILNTIN